MTKYILPLILLASTGCSACTSCFTSEVKSLYHQEVEYAQTLPGTVKTFATEEFSGIRGIRKDLTAGTERETIAPDYYYNSVGEMFCPCP